MEHALVEHDEARRTLLKVKVDSTEVHIVTETADTLDVDVLPMPEDLQGIS